MLRRFAVITALIAPTANAAEPAVTCGEFIGQVMALVSRDNGWDAADKYTLFGLGMVIGAMAALSPGAEPTQEAKDAFKKGVMAACQEKPSADLYDVVRQVSKIVRG